ncbi:CLUMA_CG011222, isoform A [Clunio marinus]|uniref:CLUMA_CG011222, isoform A n=1 Tax=Clunio marinus TaxID=568069 RepID=A0A1J1IFP6_9DIPT|nr:CLUMA_CG011222, isoform A [Clunio marinus]
MSLNSCLNFNSSILTDIRVGIKRKLKFKKRSSKRARVECLTMNDLPNEILLEIFSNLDKSSLEKSLQVNKRWHEVITQSKVTMNKLPLSIYRQDVLDDFQPPKLTRKYSRASFVGVKDWNSILKTLTSIGQSVRELTLNDCIFMGNDFHHLMKSFPMLESLTIEWCSNLYDLGKSIEMKNLKLLTVVEGGWVFDIIKCRLNYLSVSQIHMDEQQSLISFINNQFTLKSLHLKDISDLFCICNTKMKFEAPQFKFQLSQLSLDSIPYCDTMHLIPLLKQAEHCRQLCLGIDIPSIVFEYVLKNFKELEDLHVDTEQFPIKSSIFYKDLKPINSLKHLKIDGDFVNDKAIVNVLRHYPKIETLDLMNLYGLKTRNTSLWREMTKAVKQLTILKISNCNIYNISQIKFENLKEFQIGLLGFTNERNWRKFGMKNPNIKKLIIYYIQSTVLDPQFIISYIPSLKIYEYWSICTKPLNFKNYLQKCFVKSCWNIYKGN